MTTVKGNISKMRVENQSPVKYIFQLSENEIEMNGLINHHISLNFEGKIHCVACGKKIKKAFGQGFCYPCFVDSPQNSECILRPELCQGHLGIGRDPEWEEINHNQPHIVYLALTSSVKVGVTRDTQIPTRWIDQGAWKTIILAQTPNRYLAGQIEVELKQHLTDKTNWQKMLKNEMNKEVDLLREKQRISDLMPDDYKEYLSLKNDINTFEYPVDQYPTKIKSLNFDKLNQIEGMLTGIRGQYLLFENDQVINIRKFSGYEIELSF